MKRSAFTLIELSIVLIIIGLVIGGIIAGNELVKQAKNRAIISEINDLLTSIGTFKLKYDALPGDMPNANTFWSTSGNGDGNGQIQFIETVTGNGLEYLRAWDHISLSGIIKQSLIYTGNLQVGSAPSSKAGGIWSINYQTGLYKLGANNLIVLGAPGGPKVFISSVDAYTIDSKIDDGKASTGKLFSLGPNPYASGHCVNDIWTNPSADYIIPDPNNYQDCRIYYILPY